MSTEEFGLLTGLGPNVTDEVLAAKKAEEAFMAAPIYSSSELEHYAKGAFERGKEVGLDAVQEAVHKDRVKQFLMDIESHLECTSGVFSLTVDTARAVAWELRQRGF